MGGNVFEMKFDRLSGILRGLFNRASVRNATRKRRDKDRVTPRLFGNQADLSAPVEKSSNSAGLMSSRRRDF